LRELASKRARFGATFDLVGTPDAIIEGLRRSAHAKDTGTIF
jgi:hypothetical protein